MINENHIIKFKCSHNIDKGLIINNDIFINDYTLSKDGWYAIYIDIYYNNLDIYYDNLDIYTPADINVSYDYIFNISNMLYKLHTPDYYSKTYQNKRLI